MCPTIACENWKCSLQYKRLRSILPSATSEPLNQMSEEDSTVQSRKWVATLWLHQAHICLEETMKNLTDTGRIRFIAYGNEVCPTTGTLHYQTYIVCYKPTRKSQLEKWFGHGHNFDPMYGTLGQNETYCSKEGAFTKLGDEPRQGERHDLTGFKRKLDTGMQPEDIAEEEGHFGTFVKYHTGMAKYAHHIKGKRVKMDRDMPKVYIRVGDSGSGKTRWLDEQFGLSGWARMPNPTGNWWITPSVSNSDTVLIDDVGPSKIPKVEEFLEWTDRYPIEFNSKGGFLWWKPKNIIFTSNCTWEDWWPKLTDAHREAVGRRIYRIDLVFKDKPVESFYPNNADEEEV